MSLMLTVASVVGLGAGAISPAGAAPGPGTELDLDPIDAWHVTGLAAATEIDWASQVWAMTETRDRVYVGGRFTGVRRNENSPITSQPYLAAFDVNTGAWISGFRPNLNGPVYSLDVAPNGDLLVGGEFSRTSGTDSGPLVAINPTTGARSTGFDARVSYSAGKAVVMDLEVVGSNVFVGGNFSQVRSGGTTVTRGRLAKLNANTGQVNAAWRPTADGARVMSLHPSPDSTRLYVGGYFSNVNGTPDTRSLAVLRTSDGALVPGVDQGAPTDIPNCCDIIPFDFATYGDKVYAATESHLLIMYRASDMTRLGFYHTDAGGGDYQALAIDGARLWAGGHYWTSQSWDTASYPESMTMGAYWTTIHRQSATVKPQPWASAYNAGNGSHIEGFVPDFSAINGIWAILPASNGTVWFGGDLTRAGNDVVGGFAALRPVSTRAKGTNLAFRRPAAQSSTASNLVASRATDGMLSGSTAGRSFQASTTTQTNPRWTVDLGAVRNIDSIVAWRPATCCETTLNGAYVFVSNSPFASNDITATRNQAGVKTFQLGNVRRRGLVDVLTTGRYVRIQTQGNRQLVLDEVQVFAASTAVNAGPVAPASCSVSSTNGAINVSWSRAANDSATGFVVRRSRANGGYFWAARTGNASTTWRDTGVTAGQQYRYRVETQSGNAISAPRACTPSPISPSTANASPGRVASCSVTAVGGSLRVNWTRAANDNAANFVIQRSRNGGTYFWANRTGVTTSWTDSGVDDQSSYLYRVFTRSATSSSTARWCTGATKADGNVPVPQGLRVTSTTRERAVLNYTKPAGTQSVEIARNGSVIATDSDNWFTNTGLARATAYRYKVRSVAANGTRSAWSAEVIARID